MAAAKQVNSPGFHENNTIPQAHMSLSDSHSERLLSTPLKESGLVHVGDWRSLTDPDTAAGTPEQHETLGPASKKQWIVSAEATKRGVPQFCSKMRPS